MLESRAYNFWQLPSQLLVAIEHGDAGRCAELLAAGVDCDQVFLINRESKPAISIGVERGFINLVELLLKSGSAVNRRDSNGRTCLHTAVQMGYLAIGELLIKFRADVNAADNSGITPLHLACKNGHFGFARCLLSHGAKVNRPDSANRTPLFYACDSPKCRPDLVEILLHYGADVDCTDKLGRSPLLRALAALSLSYEVVEKLVSNSRRFYLDNMEGYAPIHLVVTAPFGNPDKHKVLKLIVERTKDLNVVTSHGQTALHLACSGRDLEAVKKLVAVGANANTTDFLGYTPLCTAARAEQPVAEPLLKLLIRAGVTASKDQLKKLNISWAEPLFAKPCSLKDTARRVIARQLGPSLSIWLQNNTESIPVMLRQYMLLEFV